MRLRPSKYRLLRATRDEELDSVLWLLNRDPLCSASALLKEGAILCAILHVLYDLFRTVRKEVHLHISRLEFFVMSDNFPFRSWCYFIVGVLVRDDIIGNYSVRHLNETTALRNVRVGRT